MYRIRDLSLPLDYRAEDLERAVCAAMRVGRARLRSVRLHRRSVDARKKGAVRFVVTADAELDGPLSALPRGVTAVEPYRYEIAPAPKRAHPPVVVGSGPAGLFAALVLARAGLEPIVLERGRRVEERTRDVQEFWRTGALDENSNVQFGEGGAGTFSDGKLNTGTRDERIRFVLEELAASGAPEEILFDARPHVGTDRLHEAIPALRKRIEAQGAEFRFSHRMTEIEVSDGALRGLTVRREDGGVYRLAADRVILAIGHSARDTFEMLYGAGLAMSPKPFAVGARIEHSQRWLDRAQYGAFAGHPALGAADYRLAVQTSARGVYTFCMCPGGEVVAAASEQGMVATNGMSRLARDGRNCNAALLVGVGPQDFGAHPLAGVRFQRGLETAAFRAGGGAFGAPVQTVGDFLEGRPSTGFGAVEPTYPRPVPSDLSACLPAPVIDAMREGIRLMDRRLRGFAAPDALLTGVESRSSSPVRIERGDTLESTSIRGVYPCGEGAGYAGGIVSAAVDGIRCAERLLAR